jgi:hypothetical protein
MLSRRFKGWFRRELATLSYFSCHSYDNGMHSNKQLMCHTAVIAQAGETECEKELSISISAHCDRCMTQFVRVATCVVQK